MLVRYSLLKSVAEKLGIESIERRHGLLNVKFHKESRVDPARLMSLVRGLAGAQFTPAGVLRLPLDGATGAAAVLGQLEGHLRQLAS